MRNISMVTYFITIQLLTTIKLSSGILNKAQNIVLDNKEHGKDEHSSSASKNKSIKINTTLTTFVEKSKIDTFNKNGNYYAIYVNKLLQYY